MKDKINCVCVGAKQIGLDDDDRVYVDVHKNSVDYYNKVIADAKESIKREKRDVAEFLVRRINKTDGIEKYRFPGGVVICENLMFVCGHDLQFHYVDIDDEI
jgi:hypothetical protein